jgi:hypothetical protein
LLRCCARLIVVWTVFGLNERSFAIWDGLTLHFEAPIISARSSGVNCLRLVILPDIWPKGARLGGILQLLCMRVEFRVAKKSRKNALGFKLIVGYCSINSTRNHLERPIENFSLSMIISSKL